jgi:hypothetical protein
VAPPCTHVRAGQLKMAGRPVGTEIHFTSGDSGQCPQLDVTLQVIDSTKLENHVGCGQ